MSLTDLSQVTTETVLQLVGSVQTVGAETPTVDRLDGFSNIVECHGTVVPTASTPGYSKNCEFRKTDATAGTSGLYTNVGTTLLCNFQVVDTAVGAPVPLTNTHILVGNAGGVATDVAMSGDATIANTGAVTVANSAVIGKVLTGYVSGAGTVAATDTILQGFNKLNGNVAALSAAGVGGTLTANHIIVGSAGAVATDVALSGDATIVASGALTIANSAVTGAKTADSAGVGSATGFVEKFALVVYDFAVNGGTVGAITLPTASIPNKAVVDVASYDVLTTLTSATSAATVKLGLATDGDLTTAIAINAGSNPWTQGVFTRIAGGLATPLSKKTTAARALVLTVGVENVTAGKIVFCIRYWVSQ